MPGWHELISYSPGLALLSGTLTAFAFLGVGRLIGGRWLRSIPEFLRYPAEAVAGVLTVSLVVQAFALAGLSRIPEMAALWYLALLLAVLSLGAPLIGQARQGLGEFRFSPQVWWVAPAVLLCFALLMSGAAPESRADEVSYHALAASRLLSDGGLRFYALPWEASVVPQLVWHYSLVPVYAVFGSAAGGVVSAWLGIMLAFAVASLVQRYTNSTPLAAAAALVTLSGGYTSVFFSTTGPHAFSYLAGFTAVAAVGWAPEVLAASGAEAYAAVVAIGGAGALVGKVTMLPIVGIVTVIALRDVFAATRDAPRRTTALAILILVPLVAIGPLAIWDWWASGSPLGAVTAKLTHARAFDSEAMAALDGTRKVFSGGFSWRFEAAYWSLPLVAGILAALALETDANRRLRWWLIGGAQALIIVLFLPKELRHFGGIQYPLFASGMMAARERLKGWLRAGVRFDSRFAMGINLLVAPWAFLALWLATIYVPVDFGRTDAASFVRHYSGLQADYDALDTVLPGDATLLIGRSRSDLTQYAWYARPPIYYAPRPVYFDVTQVRDQQSVYLMYVNAQPPAGAPPSGADLWLPAGYALGPLVYSDANADFYPSRTPKGRDGLAALEVFKLVRTRT